MSADVAAKVSRAAGEPSHEEVAVRAYQLFLEEGQPEGRHLEHWLRAQADLGARR